MTTTILTLLLGVLTGAALVLLVLALRRRSAQDVARALIEQTQAQKLADVQTLVDQIKAVFGDLSREALSANSDDFLKLADTKFAAHSRAGEAALEGKKKLIDLTITQMTTKLGELGAALQTLDKDRRQSYGALAKQLETTTQVTSDLRRTTASLREALANPQSRGQWGERMAEDVLRLAGFIEDVNYRKQAQTEAGSRPDFTFLLPQNRCVNMDVKFPLANYLRYLEAADGTGREQYRVSFCRDVRERIREVTTRTYIDPANGTVDYVLVFIPNEQVYGFVHEHDPTLLDDALRKKVVLCSPLTLYAVLAVIRQAVENFRFEQTSQEILALLVAFRREWGKYAELMDRMGKGLEQAMRHYEALSTTRSRKLERQLDKIDALRSQQGLALPDLDEDEHEAMAES
ncbi:MAG: DNA recombination protein RmuC [Planctomycetes bacterium]|nr:DNA recombination protein RmuC [Planctomycetota bacterium]